MTEEPAGHAGGARPLWQRIITSPWTAIGLLLGGLALGTWAPDAAAPIQDGVRSFFDILVLLIPIIILVSILPALLALFDLSGGKAPTVVILLFAGTTIIAGIFAVLLAWPIFQLPLAGPEGQGGFRDALGQVGGDLFGSAPVFAVIWSFGAAIVLHFIRVLGRSVRTAGSLPRRALGRVIYFINETIRIFLWIGEEGIARVGRFLEYALPFLLFAVGAFVPASVQDAADRAGEASSGFSALPWYLGTALLIAVATIAYLLFVAFVATRLTSGNLGRGLKTYAAPVYAFAWASSSSTLTIPVNLEAASRGLDVRRSTREFVIPLGATINLDGSMIAAMFITPVVAMAIGVDITLGQLAATLPPLIILTVGAPGLPAGMSFIAPPIIAAVLGLTGDTAAAFIGVWFAFSLGLADQFRTGVNSVNNGFLCLIVERILYGPRTEVWLEELRDDPAARDELDDLEHHFDPEPAETTGPDGGTPGGSPG